jgi:hypothetical protein
MFRRGQKSWTWRAIVAGAAAYALAFNVILAGALDGPIASTNGDPGGFEICLGHSGASDQQSPELPDAGKLHCVLCVSGAHAPVVPEGAFVAVAFGAGATIVVERVDDASPPTAPRDPGKPPRGPPLTA